MNLIYPFQPIEGETQLLPATSAGAGIHLDPAREYLLVNGGDVIAHFKTAQVKAGETVSATIPVAGVKGDTAIGPGAVYILKKKIGRNYMAAITSSGTANLYITPGNGN